MPDEPRRPRPRLGTSPTAGRIPIATPPTAGRTSGRNPTRQPPHYGFVIANNLPMDRIVATFGEPAERVDCAGLNVLVYNRPGDTVLRSWLNASGGG